MEIRVRTIDEFRSERVTIEVAPGQRAEIEITGTGAEVREMVGDAQAAEAVSAVGHKAMEDALQASDDALVTGWHQARINELEDKLVKANIKIRGYDTDRHTERDRADRERKRASELKDRLSSSDERVRELTDKLTYLEDLGEQLTEAENQVAALRRQMDNARIILSDPEVAQIRGMLSGRMSVKLADAIGKALETLA